MALADTNKAIGAVTQLLHDRLLVMSDIQSVTIGKPEPPSGNLSNPRLNLFLYEILFDGSLRNVSLDDGQPPSLWLVLKYLLTAFDEDGESDTQRSHEILGEGIQQLQSFSFFSLTGLNANTVKALKDNPELLKLTFDDANTDLLARLMQGTDEKYRCSVAFQVRPVLIAPPEKPAYSLLVGVDYAHQAIIGEKGIQIPTIPSLGAVIEGVEPEKFEAGESFAITGADLNLDSLSVQLGNVDLPVTVQRADRLVCQVPAALGSSTAISAGSLPLTVVQTLSSGRRRSSNLLVGNLLPHLDVITPGGITHVNPVDPTSNVFGNFTLKGNLLGTSQDEVYLVLIRDGAVTILLDAFIVQTPQTQLQFSIAQAKAIPPGNYRAVVRVNGQQAKNSPLVSLL